jgi:hypothetical protein
MIVTANGLTLQEWTLLGGRENHWLDCLVGSAVAASMEGSALLGMAVEKKRERKRYTKQDLARR